MFLESFKLAFVAIRVNKMRSFLTMLGIIIGISSVISIVSIGDTMRGVMAEQYETIGVNKVVLYVASYDDYRSSDDFSLEDIEIVRQAFPDEIEYATPISGYTTELINGKNKIKVSLNGVAHNYGDVQPVDIIHGRMISEGDVNSKKRHIIIEASTATTLFGREDATGQTLRTTIMGNVEDLLVVGVYKQKENAMSAMFFGQNKNAFCPYTVMSTPDTVSFALDMFVRDGTDMNVFQAKIVPFIAKMKNREPIEIYFTSAKAEMGMMDNIMLGLSAGVGAIAAISLVVGGIGIMNIMLVSVTERTREIGIRKALGARTKDVLVQFLMESALISAAGGIIGVILGVGLVSIGGAVVKISVVVNPMVIVVAVAFSAIVGIFFGIYPASKAAKADPIEALRYE